MNESHLFKEQIAEGLCKLAVLHQQEVSQCFKVFLHSQIHKEVVHHRLVHQRHAGDRGDNESDADWAYLMKVAGMIDISSEGGSGLTSVSIPLS